MLDLRVRSGSFLRLRCSHGRTAYPAIQHPCPNFASMQISVPLRIQTSLILFSIQVLISSGSLGQTARLPFFTYPLKVEPRLNANFGEMRPNHFHMGLDLFTLRRENLPMYAPADGHVSRIKIEAGGFGNALYIDHPNGATTLYAHMNGFAEELDRWVDEMQYQQESWAVDLPVPPGRFPVKRGQFIGWSGNTGASAGPHVHFEIRETATEKCLNPLRYDFPIPDNVPPDLFRIAVYDRNRSIYDQAPVMHALRKASGDWSVPGPIKVTTDKINIAVQATDRMSGIPNANGIFETRLYEGDRLVGGFRLDSIGYDETRYLNAHIDHPRRTSGGPWLQFLLPLPGDRSAIYAYAGGRHFISLTEARPHDFRLEVFDVAGNKSVARFSVQRLQRIDSLPQRYEERLHPGQYGIIDTDELQVVLSDRALYDSARLEVRKTEAASVGSSYSPLFEIMRQTIPVHDYFTVRIRPNRPIPPEAVDHMVISKVTRGVRQVRKATREKDGYMASYRDFGSFRLESDLTPPSISFYGLQDGAHVASRSSLVFSTSDNNPSIRSVRAEIDGSWIKCVRRGNTFTYRFDRRCPPGRHVLTVMAEDEAGNKTTRSVVFHR